MQKPYRHWYNWSDLNVLEALLRGCWVPDPFVVELAAGPNIAVPFVLKRAVKQFHYVSLDLERAHIQLQKVGIGRPYVQGILGDASQLPLKDGRADIFVFHHAIDDILETRGLKGVKASLEEALRALKDGGCMIFSHSIFSYDSYTLKISLSTVESILKSKILGRFKKVNGPKQKWLCVTDIRGQ